MAKSAAEVVETTSIATGVLVLLLALWLLLGPRLRGHYLNEASLAALFGLITGITILMFQRYLARGVVKDLLAFDTSAFFLYLLPPVIFNAGLSMEKRHFFNNLGSIMCMGVLGTIICFLVISLVLATMTPFHLLRIQDCLALGAIFSATDSVATLQVLDPESQPVVFSLVFGEGIINDATSVVLLGAVAAVFPPVQSQAHAPIASPPSPVAPSSALSPSPAAVPEVHDSGSSSGGSSMGLGLVTSFLYLLSTSLMLGLLAGGGITLVLKKLKSHGPHHELAIIGMLSYLSYLIAEVWGLSGILTLFCCGLAVSQWSLPCISATAATTTITAFKSLSYLAEGIIFIYVGMDALDPNKWKVSYPAEAIWLCSVLLLLLLVGRAASMVPITALHNMWGTQRLSSKDLIIIWWAGIMRGAVSVALVYFYFDNSSSDRHRATLISSTLVVVLFTTLVFGALTKPLMSVVFKMDQHRSVKGFIQEQWATLKEQSWISWCFRFRYQRVASSGGDRVADAMEGGADNSAQSPKDGDAAMRDLSISPRVTSLTLGAGTVELGKVLPHGMISTSSIGDGARGADTRLGPNGSYVGDGSSSGAGASGDTDPETQVKQVLSSPALYRGSGGSLSGAPGRKLLRTGD